MYCVQMITTGYFFSKVSFSMVDDEALNFFVKILIFTLIFNEKSE